MTQGHAMNKCWENGPNRLASGRAATNLELVRQALSVVPSKVRRASAASAAVLRLLVAFFIHTHTHTQSLTLNLNLLVSSSFLYWAWSILWYRFLFFCSSSTACFLGEEAGGQDAGLESRTWVLFPPPARLAVRLQQVTPPLWAHACPQGAPWQRLLLCPRAPFMPPRWAHKHLSSDPVLPMEFRPPLFRACVHSWSMPCSPAVFCVHVAFLVAFWACHQVGLIPSQPEAELSGRGITGSAP